MVDLRARFEQAVAALPLVAILRGVRPAEVLAIADELIAAGFTLIEVPLNSPDPFDSIARLADHCPPGVMVGAGTVLRVDDVARLADTGAGLMVSPNTDPAVISAAVVAGLVSLVGCMTPSEGFVALANGATALKVFPANRLGAGYAGDLKAVLPSGSRLFAVGGIGRSEMAAFRAGGYDGVGLGGSLYKPGHSVSEVGSAARALAGEWKRLAGA